MKKQTNSISINLNLRLTGIFIILLLSCVSQGQCLVDNFEYPILPANRFSYINQNSYRAGLLGWKTTSSDNTIEYWSNGFQNRKAYPGIPFIGLNAFQSSGLYQDYDISTSTHFNYSFAHMGSSMVLKAGPIVEDPSYTLTSRNANLISLASAPISNYINSQCNGELQTILKDDFGSGSTIFGSQPSSNDFTTTYYFSANGGINSQNRYTLTNNPGFINRFWSTDGDHTTGKDGDGYMLLFNASANIEGIFYEKKYTDLCSGGFFEFSIFAANPMDTLSANPKLKIELIDPTNNNILQSVFSDDFPIVLNRDELIWKKITLSFIMPAGLDSVILRVSNNQSDTNSFGNDIVFDDVSFSICVPPLTIEKAKEITCKGESNTLLALNEDTTSATYGYQWQELIGADWVDIQGATSIKYNTPILTQTKKYRIRYAPVGIDITNNNNLKCSGSKETRIDVTDKATITPITAPATCVGNTLILTTPIVSPNGTAITAKGWYLNDVAFDPTTPLTPADNGKTLTYRATNSCGESISNKVVITVIPKPIDVVTTANICSGEDYYWAVNNTTYTTPQSGLRIVNDGCTADQVLNLTVTPKPIDVVTTANICSGEDYYWAVNNTTYTTPQSGLRIVNDGCTADQVLNLTVTPKPIDVVTTANICSGEDYYWAVNNTTYTTPQSELRIVNDGCTADQVLNLTIGAKPEDIVTTANICSGEDYYWAVNDTTYTTPQSGLRIVNDGCTADQVLNLTIGAKPEDVITTINICSGEDYYWAVNNTTYTTPQSGLRVTNDGCTADQVLNLTVTPKPEDIVTTANICSGEDYYWAVNDTTYTTPQSGLRIANDGCTADQVLNLTVTPKPTDVVTTDSICSGETYTWTVNNTPYTTPQSGLKIVNDGCTADQVLNLTVIPKPVDVVTTDSICSGETYTWTVNNTTYTTSQSGLRVTNDGCTADQVLNLTVIPKPTDVVTTDSICSGETYTWTVNNTTYTTSQSGLRIANDGCTADQVLNLTVIPKPEDIVTTANICSGEDYYWAVNDTTYTTPQSGLRIANDGCTADQVLNLTVTPKPEDVVTTANICSGEDYYWAVNDTTYTTPQSGLRIANDGCTADQVLNLTVIPKPVDVVTTDSICSGETYTWTVNNTTYTTSQSGLRITNDGCTADQVLNLTVIPKPADVVTTNNICSGGTYTWAANGLVYTTPQSGLRITNDGCTADQVLNLTIGAKPEDVITTDNICSGETYTWAANGLAYTTPQSGLKITNDGCTADQVLNLTVTPKPIDVVTTDSICSGETYTWTVNNTTYTTSQSGLRIANDGCTADQVLNLTVTPKPEDVVTTDSICSGETYTWTVNNTPYTTSQSGLRIANDGCTADQVLNLTVTPKPEDIVTTANICFGEDYYWAVNDTTYTTPQSGLRIVNDGCTADQVLNLTIGAKPEDAVTTANICFGEDYYWAVNDTTYTTPQSGLRIANDGCTADQVLNLTIGAKPEDIVTTANICFGEDYYWAVNGLVYTTPQSGLRIANDGCTADQVLNLTVTPKPEDVVTTINICSGEDYYWAANGLVYTTPQSGLRIANDGCTADQVLNLTIGAKPEDVVTTANICSGEDYYWAVNDTTYTTPQSGLKIINDGCTADQVLNLTVTPKPEDIVTTVSICSDENYTWAANKETYTTPQDGLRITNDGCTADQVLNLTVTPKPADEITRKTICSGESYVWLANGESYSAEQDGLRITNDGCRADEVLYLTVIPKPEDIITRDSICYGDTYRWDANGKHYTTEQNGLRITKNGCTADRVLYLTINPPLIASIVPDSLIPELCSGDNNGSFSVAVTGGIAPYSASLDEINGTYQPITGTEQSYANLSSGEHIVYIKDTKGCTTELSVTIVEGAVLDPQFEIIYDCVDNASANRVMVTVDASNTNLADIDYALDTGNYQASNIFINVAPGLHTIYARNSNGCVQPTRPLFIKEIAPLTLTLADGELNEIVATATGGSEIYQYSLNDGPKGPSNKFIIYKSGVYTVSVTDTNGCTATESRYFEYIDICIPNYFTPNADGIGDTWGPNCATNYKNLTYTIFDRYGRVIATYKLGQRWDGRYKGTELTSGDYWYTLKLNDPKDNREFVGHFTLYR